MKQRFDSLDVMAMVAHVQRHLLGRRVVNIYDGGSNDTTDSGGNNQDTYLFKLDGGSSGTSSSTTTTEATTTTTGTEDQDTNHAKVVFLCLQSGIRFHPVTHFSADGTFPTPFCSKLRKHLRGLRLVQVQQIGTMERVVLFSFLGNTSGSSTTTKYYVILELYAKGNLILLQDDYTILALLRSHVYHKNDQEDDDNENNHHHHQTAVAVQVGKVYPVTYAADVQVQGGIIEPEQSRRATTGLWSNDPTA
jgi:hypothetical protein